ncbi:MAG: SDR family NAD(P)-dependent oxidoreductase [Nitrospirae bacterium]|nr:SDR family NAD(P)-dependent oxidoreductase [Nitrospirota bacterium]
MIFSYNQKTVLITGAAGFIGSHLARRLVSEGAEVHVLLKKESSHARISDIAKRLSVWYGDLRDFESICGCLRKARPQVIYHLAAFRDVSRDFRLIDSMIDINIRGTMNLLRGVIDEKIDLTGFVNTGSSEEYGDGPVPFREDQREVPVSPYSASKVAASYFCQMAHKSLDLPVVTLRPFLTYGPGQADDMFIPSLIRHCLEKKDFAMTAGDQTREFNYIDDIVDAYLLAGVTPSAHGKIINIGNGTEYTVRDVAGKIVAMMGSPIRLLIGALDKRPGEAVHFYCDDKNARQLLNWQPKTGLDEGLKKTIEWYRHIL